MTRRRLPCPQCGEKSGVPIIYGYPSEELFEESERGEVVLGGCCELLDAPNRHCLTCQHQWRNERRRKASEAS